jgi:type IV pilus assembly protein PilA
MMLQLANGKKLRTQRGQGMTEYIVIVALIAVAAIAVYQFFGQTIRSQTAGIAREVSGQSASAAITAAQTAADAAVGEGKKKGLNDYKNDNSH